MTWQPVLTPADKAKYFPALGIPEGQIEAAIGQAQLIAEDEARRQLGLVDYTEILRLGANQSALLSYWPVSQDPPMTVEYRGGGGINRWGLAEEITPWYALSPESYLLDETGWIHINTSLLAAYGRISQGTQIRASYRAGFSLSVSTYDAEHLKRALGSLLVFIASPSGQGIVSVREEMGQAREFVQFATPEAYAIPERLLMPFRKYRPRGC